MAGFGEGFRCASWPRRPIWSVFTLLTSHVGVIKLVGLCYLPQGQGQRGPQLQRGLAIRVRNARGNVWLKRELTLLRYIKLKGRIMKGSIMKRNLLSTSKSKAPSISEESPNTAEREPHRASLPSRRKFIRAMGSVGAAAAGAAALPLEPLFGGKNAAAEASVASYKSNSRANASCQYRMSAAQAEKSNVAQAPDNGDAGRFSDFSGTWSKCLRHDALGIPNSAASLSLVNALGTGKFSDFERILVGNPGGTHPTAGLNGPQTSLAYDLEGRDSHATVIPPAPSVTSAESAAEAVEHYWAALMRDVNFTDYPASSLAAQACADLNNLSFIRSNQNNEFPYPVTPQNLFRGQIVPGDSSVQGPYLSQFLLQPTFFGALPFPAQYQRFLSVSEGGADFMTDPTEYLHVQNGGVPNFDLAYDPTYRFLRMGRDLAAYTHVDVLYQAYFTAFFVLAGIGAPLNAGNPYHGSPTEHGFGTLDGVDAAATLAAMATRALKAAWFHKWVVNLRPRPEEYGALVQANLTAQHPMPQAAAALHPDVLNSAVLPIILATYGSYLLPQAFPEGSPTHPCYPTGHGTVGGACITALKFFFDGNQPLRPLLQAAGTDVSVPSADGLSLIPYTGADRDQLTINGELDKLGWNISIGHGIHAGIHFRSSSYYSLLLGEQTALSVLQDRAAGYNEPFTINLTKFDGSTATISNQNRSLVPAFDGPALPFFAVAPNGS
jgi:hypothetical protein